MPRQPRTFAKNIGLKTSTVACNPDWQTPSNGRHHIFLFDGTWNDATGPNPAEFLWDNDRQLWQSRANPQLAYPPVVTNVVKTHHALAADGATQVTHYFRGVGNDDENDAINKAAEGAVAHAERLIRNAAYCEFLKNYRTGDQLSVLGFSRGAASARLFAAYVRKYGVLDEVMIESRFAEIKNSGETWEEVWTMSPRDSTALVAGAEVPVAFLGAWDTVATSIAASAADWAVPDTTGHAVHCVALDEARKLFRPTLLDYTPAQAPNVKEVWFPGVHSDVGGSYFHDALSRRTLKFMWQCWNESLSAQALTPLNWREAVVAAQMDVTGLPWLRHSEGGLTARVGGTAPRECLAMEGKPPRVHPSVEQFIQQGGLQFCEEGAGFPPECRISGPVYQPLAYPGAASVELYDRTGWPA